MFNLVFQISRIAPFVHYFQVQFFADANNERNVCEELSTHLPCQSCNLLCMI
jgi:hypothetical protein